VPNRKQKLPSSPIDGQPLFDDVQVLPTPSAIAAQCQELLAEREQRGERTPEDERPAVETRPHKSHVELSPDDNET
jgi:hypothetical protein